MKRAFLLVLCALAVGCGGDTPQPSAPPRATVKPIPSAAAQRQAPGPEPVFSADELAAHVDSVRSYPPTACRMRALMGAEGFAALAPYVGYYPVEPSGDGGHAFAAATCPQPGCEGLLVWVDPSGAMVIAVEGETLELWANRSRIKSNLPQSVSAFVDEVRARRAIPLDWKRWRTSGDPAACRGPAALDSKSRYLAARARTRCDPEHSSHWGSGFVKGDAPVYFRAAADPRSQLAHLAPPGQLIRLGHTHAKDDGFVCASHAPRDGAAVVGWLPVERLEQLPLDDGFTLANAQALAAALPVSRASWLSAKASVLGDLTIREVSPTQVRIDLQSTSSGHLCTVEGELERKGPRVLGAGSAGCGVVALVFDNGLFLWEDGDCSGARTTCTGAYTHLLAAP